MSTKSETQKFLETEIKPKLDGIQKDHDTQLPRLLKLGGKLDEEIKKKKKADPETIKYYLAALAPEVKTAGELVSRAVKLQEKLHQAPQDPTLGDDFKAVEQMTHKVSELRGKLDRNFEKLKAGIDLANDAIQQGTDPASAFAEQWAVMETALDKHLANCKWRVKQTGGFFEKGKAAAADHDEVLLNQWVADSAKFVRGEPTHAEVETQFKAFCAWAKSNGLQKEAQDQLAREIPELKKKFDETTLLEQEISRNSMGIKGLKVVPIDYKKAAAQLKIPPALIQKFKDALADSGPAREKLLDGIGTQLNPKTTGRKMLEVARKY